jgi:hypothetical protein
LASEFFVLAMHQDGTLQEIQRLPNLPECFEGASLGGHIALSASGDASMHPTGDTTVFQSTMLEGADR